MGKLYALSDIHITHKFNYDEFKKFFSSLPSRRDDIHDHDDDDDGYLDSMVFTDFSHRDTRASSTPGLNFTQDGLILAGDIGEKFEHMRFAFDIATQKFKTVWWVPGNHELYTLPGEPMSRTTSTSSGMDAVEDEDAKRDARLTHTLRGEAKYQECCRIASEYGVLTPEDEFIRWEYEVPGSTEKEAVLVCPIFTLYDYSFRPSGVTREKVLDWAMEQQTMATDEVLLHPDPYSSRDDWCRELVDQFAERLTAAQSRGLPLVIINHWPLREDLIRIPLAPRFTPWCGTKMTEDWHKKFNAKVVVSGHLHVRRTDWIDNTRFEEVSLGYPRQWETARGLGRWIPELMREILPGRQSKEQVEKRQTIFRGDGK